MRCLVLFSLVLAGLLGGCTHVMSESALAVADSSITYAGIKSNPEVLAGKNVLVGGIIAGISSSGDLLELEVAQLELLSNGVPDESSQSAGRFLVISGELLDPLFFKRGSLVTVIGEIKGQRKQKLEGTDYRYPLISAKEIRLFRPSDLSSGRPANPYRHEMGDGTFLLRPPGSSGQ